MSKLLAAALSSLASPLPEACAAQLRKNHGVESAFALHGVMRRGGKRARNRDGYLCLLDDRFVFIAKKLTGWHSDEVLHTSLRRIDFEKGLLFDALHLRGETLPTVSVIGLGERHGERLGRARTASVSHDRKADRPISLPG